MAAAIMMGALELGKVVTAAWLKNEWDGSHPEAPVFGGGLLQEERT